MGANSHKMEMKSSNIMSINFIILRFLIYSNQIFVYNYRVKSWADKLGTELASLGYFITRTKEVEEVRFDIKFNFCRATSIFCGLSNISIVIFINLMFLQSLKSVNVVPRLGEKLVADMATDIKNMMDSKVGAIKVSFIL